MKHVEPTLAEAYRKDAAAESFLERVNDALAHTETYSPLPELFPTLHIVGVPRSGTTLLNQLLARHLDVGYVNHIVAAFWRAPVTGVRLSRKILGDEARPSSLSSDFGRTARVEDPHEFGYFWRELLQSPEYRELGADDAAAINWNHVATVLTHVTHAFGKPVVFKSFQLGTLMAEVQEALPRTCFVRLRRDPVDSARSILKMRERFVGDRTQWASIKPLAYKRLAELDIWGQVAGQVFLLERALDAAVQRVNGRNVLEVEYDALCADPTAMLDAVRNLLSANGPPVSWTSAARPELQAFAVAPGDADTERIQAAIDSLRTSPDFQ